MPTTAIVNALSRLVQGQLTVSSATGVPGIALPLLPQNGSFAIKGRIQANSSDESATQSWEVDLAGNMAGGTMTYTQQGQVLTPTTLPTLFSGATVTFTASGTQTRQMVVTLTNGTEGPTFFWTWNLTVERCATS